MSATFELTIEQKIVPIDGVDLLAPLVANATAAAAAAAEVLATFEAQGGDAKTAVVGRRWGPIAGGDAGANLTIVLTDPIPHSGTLNVAKIWGGSTGGAIKLRQFTFDPDTNTFTRVGADYVINTAAGALSTTDPAMAVVKGNYLGIAWSVHGAATFTSVGLDNPGFWRSNDGEDLTTLVAPTAAMGVRLEAQFEIAYTENAFDQIADVERQTRATYGTLGGTTVLVIDGNSLMAGVGGATPPSTYLAASLPDVTIYNVAAAGQSTQDMTADAVAQIDPIAGGTFDTAIVIAHEIYNDVATNNLAPAAAVANMITYCAARQAAGFVVGVGTIPDCPVTGGGFASHPRADYITELKSQFNAHRLAGTPFADFLVDYDKVDANGTALYPELHDRNNATYYQGDKLHWTSAGGQVAERAIRHAIRDWMMTR